MTLVDDKKVVLLVVDVEKGKEEENSLIILLVGSSGKLVTSFSLCKGTMIEVRNILAKYSYNVKNGLSIIKSKSLSKNLSNEKKQFSFCCLQDKT